MVYGSASLRSALDTGGGMGRVGGMSERRKPEWAEEDGGDGFAGAVVRGVEGGHDGMPGMVTRRGTARVRVAIPGPDELLAGLAAHDRVLLARAITLVESRRADHRTVARQVVRAALAMDSGRSVRIGITGVPGAGKSTFIETFGLRLCERGHRVAVLAVDPTSGRSGGSILGDKTRMEDLARHPAAFIRPSPSGGELGGVAARTRESVILCEAAGFDVILVETVGVGQSEVTVRGMVDFFLLLQIAGAGDDLQGIKKGIIEMADAIVVNKADGDNKTRALRARVEYERVLHYLQPFTEGWQPPALSCSALEGDGVDEVWECIHRFRAARQEGGRWIQRRREQERDWFLRLVREAALARFFDNGQTRERLQTLEARVAAGQLPALEAAEILFPEHNSPGTMDEIELPGG